MGTLSFVRVATLFFRVSSLIFRVISMIFRVGTLVRDRVVTLRETSWGTEWAL